MTVALALVGPGVIGRAHHAALARVPETRVATLVGIDAAVTQAVAAEFGIPNATTGLDVTLGASRSTA